MKAIIKKILLVSFIIGTTSFVLYNYLSKAEKTKTDKINLDKKTKKHRNLILSSFDNLNGFENDDMIGAIKVNKKSCSVFLKLPKDRQVGTSKIPMLAGDMHNPCNDLNKVKNKQQFIKWLKNNFNVYLIQDDNGDKYGKFTGYFEAELKGSLNKTNKYKYPIYGLPKDMIFLNKKKWLNNGININLVGMIKNNQFIPYYKRNEIDAKKINAPVLAYGVDKTDVFLLHIQGSGRILLPDNTVVRLGYAGNNGHKYKSLGNELISKGHLKLSQASWAGIRNWIKNNPDKADKVLGVNARYIFFKKIKNNTDGPIGKMGVDLIPNRSLAVDYHKIPMGLNVWLDAQGVGNGRIQRIMNTQDTGSAIRGWIRGDFFWGYGNDALKYAGKMKSKGFYYIFLPKMIRLAKSDKK